MLLGVHVSIAGRIDEAIDRAALLRINCMQIFSRNPRGWQAAKLKSEEVKAFKSKRLKAKIFPILVHIPYIINLASPEDGLWKRSIKSYAEDIKRADTLGAEYFVTHLGSHKGKGEGFGIKRFAEGMNRAIAQAKPKLTVLLENTAGSGDGLGYKFEHLKVIISLIKEKSKVGVCLDSAHTFESGYDIKTKKGLDETISRFDKLVGLNRLKAIHLNDSKSLFASHVDRHWHIGKGEIGASGIGFIVNHPKLRNLPFILETPKETEKSDLINLKKVRALRRG